MSKAFDLIFWGLLIGGCVIAFLASLIVILYALALARKEREDGGSNGPNYTTGNRESVSNERTHVQPWLRKLLANSNRYLDRSNRFYSGNQTDSNAR